jgi:hypothetical protein
MSFGKGMKMLYSNSKWWALQFSSIGEWRGISASVTAKELFQKK